MVFAMTPSLPIWHTLVFCQDSWTDWDVFWHTGFHWPILHCVLSKFGHLQNKCTFFWNYFPTVGLRTVLLLWPVASLSTVEWWWSLVYHTDGSVLCIAQWHKASRLSRFIWKMAIETIYIYSFIYSFLSNRRPMRPPYLVHQILIGNRIKLNLRWFVKFLVSAGRQIIPQFKNFMTKKPRLIVSHSLFQTNLWPWCWWW